LTISENVVPYTTYEAKCEEVCLYVEESVPMIKLSFSIREVCSRYFRRMKNLIKIYALPREEVSK